MDKFNALVIGGGPAGTTTALLLAKAGWSVALVEKKSFPRRKVCGEYISATTLPLLEELGIGNVYQAQAGPHIKRVGLFTKNKQLTATMPASIGAQWGRALGREVLDTLLMEQALNAGVRVWQPWTATSLQQDSNCFRCDLSSKNMHQTISSDIVIIAQGSWEQSIISSQKIKHRCSDLFAFKAHLRDCQLDTDLMPMFAFPGGYGGLVTTDHNRISFSCCIRRDMLWSARKQYPRTQAGEAVLEYIMSTCEGVKKVCANSTREGSWLAVGPIQPGIRKHHENGIFYTGNAAAEAHPIIAEGISMAIQSAWLLCKLLITKQDDINFTQLTNIGQAYSKQWHEQFANRLHAAALFAQFAMHSTTTGMLTPIIDSFPNLLTLGATLSGKTNRLAL